jgi:predicted peptidase
VVKVEASSPLRGTLLDEEISSPTIGRSLRYRVYLPPEYASDTHRYPVLYMLHGIGGITPSGATPSCRSGRMN